MLVLPVASAAMKLSVVVDAIVIGPAYTRLAVVGVEPSMVKYMIGVGSRSSVADRVTSTELKNMPPGGMVSLRGVTRGVLS